VPAKLLRRLVLKELGDNALDTGAETRFGQIGPGKYFVEDDGPGLDGTPEQIAALFSIRRPMVSTKLLRLPQRGALGNGLRVVAGAVLASEGSLAVITRNRRITLQPRADGRTAVVKVTKLDHPLGTRVEIGLGAALPTDDVDPFLWAQAAAAVASTGKTYEGKSSAHWYDAAQFHELILACGSQPVRSLISELDGCSHAKAGEIIAAAGLNRMSCERITRQQATKLLLVAREQTRPVSSERLGYVGRDAGMHYAIETGIATLGSSDPLAEIPFVVESWADKRDSSDEISVGILINRTPTVAEIVAWRDHEKDICLVGSGLRDYAEDAPKKGGFDVRVNVTTPCCPITSDGKAPDLSPFTDQIVATIAHAMRKAQRAAPKDEKVSQKDVVLDNLDDAISSASGDGEYRFNERQVFYQLRPIVLEETGRELTIGNFKGIITDYENENGEIPDMYREPRGSIYHPHRRETIPLGTLMVEEYERPIWTFNKLVYIEKEGFSEALKDDGWAERHDCALLSSKGFSSRAARDLIDKLAEHDEPVTVFCVHDADALGSMIYQTLQETTRARGARKIKIINLGLEPWDGINADLEFENVKYGKRQPVADYVLERADGEHWEEWLQTHRIELNAMTTPEFIRWLDQRMAEHGDGKLIPPDDALEDHLDERLEARLRDGVRERILREAGFEDQVAGALSAIARPGAADLKGRIRELFRDNPEREWRDAVEQTVERILARWGVE
jgi:hypothetical protein